MKTVPYERVPKQVCQKVENLFKTQFTRQIKNSCAILKQGKYNISKVSLVKRHRALYSW